MLDLIHKLVYAGIGFAALTEQKAQEIVAELEKRGDVSSAEGKKLVQELMDKAHRHREQFEKAVRDEVKKLLDKMPCASRQDLDEIRTRLERLEQRLGHSPQTPDDSL